MSGEWAICQNIFFVDILYSITGFIFTAGTSRVNKQPFARCKKNNRKEQPNSHTANVPEQGKISKSTYLHRQMY